MAIVRIATTLKNSMLTPVRDAIDAGAGAGTIKIYTSPMATLPSDAISTQTLLGTLTFSDPSGASPTGGVFTASSNHAGFFCRRYRNGRMGAHPGQHRNGCYGR